MWLFVVFVGRGMIFLNSVLTELNNTTSLKIDCNKNAMTTREVKRHLDVVYVYIKTKAYKHVRVDVHIRYLSLMLKFQIKHPPPKKNIYIYISKFYRVLLRRYFQKIQTATTKPWDILGGIEVSQNVPVHHLQWRRFGARGGTLCLDGLV